MLDHDECCLCGQIRGERDHDLIARLLPGQRYVRRVLLESESFAVIPSLGPLADGHVLLCPKAHVDSFARLDPRLQGELDEVKERLLSLLAATFTGDLHLFEHGMAAHGRRPLCTVDHAHLHCVPLPPGLHVPVTAEDAWSPCDGSLAALRRVCRGREYVFYAAPEGVARVRVARGRGFASQHMRRVLSAALPDGVDWNWRRTPDARGADDTWRRCTQSVRLAAARRA